MCVTPAGKIGNCTCGMPQLLPHSGKKAPFYQNKTVSFHFLSLPMLLRRRSGVVSIGFQPVSCACDMDLSARTGWKPMLHSLIFAPLMADPNRFLFRVSAVAWRTAFKRGLFKRYLRALQLHRETLEGQ